MNVSRLSSTLLIAAQAALFCWGGMGLFGAIVSLIILLSSVIPKLGLRLQSTTHSLLLVIAALLFARTGINHLINRDLVGLFAVVAETLLVIQSLELVRASRALDSNYLPGLSMLTLSLFILAQAGNVGVKELGYITLIFVFLLIYVLRPDLSTMWFAGKNERHKAKLLFAMFVAALVAGNLFQQEVRQDLPFFQKMIKQVSAQGEELEDFAVVRSNARLVDRVKLGSIAELKRSNPKVVAFTVHAELPPGYMRTVAFTSFDGQEWQNRWTSRRRNNDAFVPLDVPSGSRSKEVRDLFELTAGMSLYRFPGKVQGKYSKLTIDIPDGSGELIPLPLATAYLYGQPGNRIHRPAIDPHQSVVLNGFKNQHFEVLIGVIEKERPDPAYLKGLLEVPAKDSQFLREYADQIFRGQATLPQKQKALEDHFRTDFSYSLESDLESNLGGQSQLRAFLEQKRQAHCEYFATASALLLRSQGIPCRLAAGYLVCERNDDDEYYIAASRHAHAWVEAYDSATNEWLTVESTPSIKEFLARFNSGNSQAGQSAASIVSGGESVGLLAVLNSVWEELVFCWRAITASRFAWLLPIGLCTCLIAIRYRSSSDGKSHKARNILSSEVLQADLLAKSWDACDLTAKPVTALPTVF